MPIRLGVIFDADGVLIDSEQQSFEALRLAVEKSTQGAVQLTSEHVAFISGRGDACIVDALNRRYGCSIDPVALTAEKIEIYRDVIKATPLRVAAGAERFIDELDGNKIAYAVATSAPRVKLDISLESAGLLDRFPIVVSAEDVETSKPNPRIFLIAAERMQVSPRGIVVFEDTLNGIEAANRAGMFSVGVVGTFSREHLGEARAWIDGFDNVGVDSLRTWIDSTH